MYNNDIIRNEIQDGISQVDSSFSISEFSCEVNNRVLRVDFTATNADGESIEVNDLWH